MVKHRQLDDDEGSLTLANTENKQEFFCFRCNYRKKAKIRVFWQTHEGRKIICNGCYMEVLKKREKKQRKNKKRKTIEPSEEEGENVLCPFLLEQEDEEEAMKAEKFIDLLHKYIKKDCATHYYQRFQKLLDREGFDLQKQIEQVANVERVFQLVEAVLQHMEFLKSEQQKYLEKIHKKLALYLEKEKYAEEWSKLENLDDLPKLQAVLQSHFSRVVGTLSSFLPKVKEKGDADNGWKVTYWNTLSAVAKLACEAPDTHGPSAKELFKKAKELQDVFTTKQQQKLERWIEQL